MEFLWQRFRNSLYGRLFAAAVIAGAFGASAAAEISPTKPDILLYTIVSAVIGLVAVGLLERRDQQRDKSVDWKNQVKNTADKIQAQYSELPAAAIQVIAKDREEQRFTPVVLVGFAVGVVSILSGAVMFAIRVVQFFSVK